MERLVSDVWHYLVGIDEVARRSSFPSCRHGGDRGCNGAILHGDHHCDAAGDRSTGDVILIFLIGLRQIIFEEIIDWSEKRCCTTE